MSDDESARPDAAPPPGDASPPGDRSSPDEPPREHAREPGMRRRPTAGQRMAEAEAQTPPRATPAPPPVIEPARYGRYVGLLAIVILIAITINTVVTKPNGDAGVAPGRRVPPFAVPLALGSLEGEADVATRAGEGAAGNVPACRERGADILNICELYEQGPVVLVLFVDSGSCADVLSDVQALAPGFPGVRFAAVAIRGSREKLRKLIRSHAFTFPVGIDKDGALAALYSLASCPQLTFVLPGGVVQSKALLRRPSRSQLRARIEQLQAAARAKAG